MTTAMRLLGAFVSGERAVGLGELARRVGTPKSTAHRLLNLLASEGFVTPVGEGRYALGLALWDLGSRVIAGLDLREVAHPYLEALRNATEEAVHLAVLDGHEVVYIDRLESPSTLQLFRRIGFRMPAHVTSSGKAMLAHASAAALECVLASGLERLTARTITTRAGFVAEVRRARMRGYATSFGESEPGVHSVGAAILGLTGESIAAISVAGPDRRLPRKRIAAVARQVRAAAAAISTGMGNRENVATSRYAAPLR